MVMEVDKVADEVTCMKVVQLTDMKIPIEDLTDMILAIGDTYRDDFRSVRKVGRHVDACSDATCQPNLLLMQVAPPVDQICNQYKWRHLVAKFSTNGFGTTWWPNLQLMQEQSKK